MSSGRVFTLPRSCLQYFTLSLQREQAVTRTEKEERQSRWVGRGGAIGRKGFRNNGLPEIGMVLKEPEPLKT
eukprot:1541519-Rhodomonas_salina.2